MEFLQHGTQFDKKFCELVKFSFSTNAELYKSENCSIRAFTNSNWKNPVVTDNGESLHD